VQKEQCFSLGKITKLHGYKGGLILHIDSSTPQFFKDLESVFLEINQELVPFFFAQKGKLNGKKLLVYFEDISPEKASALVGRNAYLPQSMFPEVEDDLYYDKAIMGYDVIVKDASIGKIVDVVENSGQNLFVVASNSSEYLIPAVDPFITSLDQAKKIIYLELPEGLLDL
jgi:16S rRNA processing protein RimM